MSARILQDIKPNKDKKAKIVEEVTNEVVKPKSKILDMEKVGEKIVIKRIDKVAEEVLPPTIPPISKFGKRSSFKKIIFYVVLVLLLLGGSIFIINKYFSYVNIFITKKTHTYNFQKEQFTASKDINSPLHFEIMIVDGEDKQPQVFSETKELSTKAKGQVVIYNKYSTKPQKLLINTKLVDDKKHIYLTDKAVTVPGYTGSGSKVVPGSVTVGIVANAVGPDYNGDPRDFSISGFIGTDKATKIYARSNSPLTGGASGTSYVLSAEDKGKAIVSGSTALYNKLTKKFLAQVPPEYVVYEDSIQFTKGLSDEIFQSATPDGYVTIKGSISAPIFKRSELQESIIRKAYPNVKAEEISEIISSKIDSFKFEYLDTGFIIGKDTTSIKFTLLGDDTLIWNPNIEDLKSKLLGKDKDNLNEIFISDSGIAKARTNFRPPWQSNVPIDIDHIKVILE